MKLELKENMYYRAYSGCINKITSIKDFNEREYLLNGFYINKDTIKKASYNIIDILEVGDYVNGSEILGFENEYIEEKDTFMPIGVVTENCYLENTDSWIIEKDIKTIVTKEQMEQMTYKVGE